MIGIRAAIDGAGLVQLPLAYLAPEIDADRLVPLLDTRVQPQIEPFASIIRAGGRCGRHLGEPRRIYRDIKDRPPRHPHELALRRRRTWACSPRHVPFS